MARPARKQPDEGGGEVPKMDFKTALKVYREDIKPAVGKVGEHSQELSTAYKFLKKQCHIQSGAAKLAFKLDGMEESKRDDFLRGLNGLLKELRIFMPSDLVDAAQGAAAGDVIPSGERPKPTLVTIPPAVEGDTDLADGAE